MSTPRWLSDAVALYQTTTIAVTGTWATSDTVTLTINSKDLTVTIGTLYTIADVVAAIVAAVNATSKTDGVGSGAETRNVGGQEIPEFTEIVATNSSPNVVLTATTVGKPFTVTAAASTVGDGDVGAPTNSVSATGPNHISNVDNLSTGSALANTNDLVFDSGAGDCLYDLDQNGITLTSLTKTNGFTGDIGLRELNADNPGKTYREYRTAYFKVSATTVTIGGGTGDAKGMTKLNLGSVVTSVTILDGGPLLEDKSPAVKLLATHANNVVNIFRGTLALAGTAGEVATVKTLKIGYINNQPGDSTVYCGTGVTLTDVDISGGETTIQSATTTIDMDGGTLHLLAGAHASIDCDSGLVDYRGTGTCTDCKLGGGATLDLSKDMRAKTFTTLTMNAGSVLNDPFGVGVYTNGIILNRCTINDVTINVGPNRTLSVA